MNEKQAELIPARPGELMMQERKARGLSVAEISSKIRIRDKVIRALEADDTDWIAPVYLRGYLKSYANELGLDLAEIGAEAEVHAAEDPELQPVFEVDPKRKLTERWLKSGSYLVATALVAALVWQVTQQAVQFSQGTTSFAGNTVTQPASELAESNVGSNTNTGRTGTHLAASIASLEKMRSPAVDSGSAAEQAWSAITSPVEEAPMIRISVSADSWIEIIDSEGQTIEKDLLRGGNERTYAGTPPFELLLGRPSAVVVEFQGEAIDLEPHVRGDVARLTLGAAEQPDT